MSEFLGNNKCNNNIISYIYIRKKKFYAIISKIASAICEPANLRFSVSKLKLNRRGKISSVILIVCIIVGVVIVSYAALTHSSECPKFQFETIASHLADEQEYRDGYKCVQFSKELLSRLNDAGYAADYCVSSTHAWIEAHIPIEATQGIVISPMQMANHSAYANKTCNTYRGDERG